MKPQTIRSSIASFMLIILTIAVRAQDYNLSLLGRLSTAKDFSGTIPIQLERNTHW
jgi:hypothetical protein